MKTLILILMIAVALGIAVKWYYARKKVNQINTGSGGEASELKDQSPGANNNQTT